MRLIPPDTETTSFLGSVLRLAMSGGNCVQVASRYFPDSCSLHTRQEMRSTLLLTSGAGPHKAGGDDVLPKRKTSRIVNERETLLVYDSGWRGCRPTQDKSCPSFTLQMNLMARRQLQHDQRTKRSRLQSLLTVNYRSSRSTDLPESNRPALSVGS